MVFSGMQKFMAARPPDHEGLGSDPFDLQRKKLGNCRVFRIQGAHQCITDGCTIADRPAGCTWWRRTARSSGAVTMNAGCRSDLRNTPNSSSHLMTLTGNDRLVTIPHLTCPRVKKPFGRKTADQWKQGGDEAGRFEAE